MCLLDLGLSPSTWYLIGNLLNLIGYLIDPITGAMWNLDRTRIHFRQSGEPQPEPTPMVVVEGSEARSESRVESDDIRPAVSGSGSAVTN